MSRTSGAYEAEIKGLPYLLSESQEDRGKQWDLKSISRSNGWKYSKFVKSHNSNYDLRETQIGKIQGNSFQDIL